MAVPRSPERRHGRSDETLRRERRGDRATWEAWPGTVLLVDCFPDEQDLYGEALRDAGFDTVIVCEAAAALDLAVSTRAGAVVVELTMADSGLALIKKLRHEPLTNDTAIVVVS